VDKYEGDAIMAFWGRPYPQDDHALRACNACLNMIDTLNDLNAKWKSEGKLPLNIGVGLNSGPMVVGNMGSNRRFNYTVMGDAVNLGARLEGQNKEYATHIIISEGTYRYAKEHFVCRELDLIRVKGKMKPVAIYELMARIEEKEKYEPLVKIFRQGLTLYRQGKFAEAKEAFEDILSAYPNDGPSKLFAGRCQAYVSTPPSGVWDGVFIATSK
jgi:adenylate cyclase